MAKKRIAVLTLSSGEPRLMTAGVDDGQVFIIKCEQLERSMLKLKMTLPSKLKKLKKGGFVLLVDEVIPYFSKYGRSVKLDDVDVKGRPVVAAAMQAYSYLKSFDGIVFPAGTASNFDISPSLVEEVRGTDGKMAYNVDWDELRPETYALLFTLYAATQDSLLDVATMKEMLDILGKSQTSTQKNQSTMDNVFHGRHKRLSAEGRPWKDGAL